MSTTVIDVLSAPATNPFVGLRSIEETGALFGRDSDFLLVRERIYSARTTLLFAGSGVGKTSFLLAKLLPNLGADTIACYHRDWADRQPQSAVVASVRKKLGLHDGDAETHLRDVLKTFRRPPPSVPREDRDLPLRPVRTKNQEFLLVLDQFEEVFQYWSLRSEFSEFLDDLCSSINDEDLKLRVVLSMRDDFLGNLSVFDNRVPDLFNNYYRLKHVTKTQAIEIIRRTAGEADLEGTRRLVDELATTWRPGSPEPAPQLLQGKVPAPVQVALHRIWLPFNKSLRFFFPKADRKAPRKSPVARQFVVLPYLQIVCRQLWEDRSADDIFLKHYGEKQSRTRARSPALILDAFCRDRLNELETTRRKDLAARAFDFLMTREGAKMAYQLDRLAEHMGVSQQELQPVLSVLSRENVRILRRFKGADGSWWFELYHDMYAPILYQWKREYQYKRSQTRRRRYGGIVLALLLLLIWIVPAIHEYGLIGSAVSDYPASAYAQLRSQVTFGGRVPFLAWVADNRLAHYWDRRAAQAELEQDRDRALLFRTAALETNSTPTRRNAALAAAGLDYTHYLWRTFRPSGDVNVVAFSDDERQVFVASSLANQIWNIDSGSLVASAPPSNRYVLGDKDESTIVQATFLKSGTQLITLTKSNVLQLWQVSSETSDAGAQLKGGCPVRDIAAFAIDASGTGVFAAAPSGVVQRVPVSDLEKTPRDRRECDAGDNGARKAAATTHGSDLVRLVASADGVFSVARDGTVSARKPEHLNSSRVLVSGPAVVVFSPDLKRIAVLKNAGNDKSEFQVMTVHGEPAGKKSLVKGTMDFASLDFFGDNQAILLQNWTGQTELFDGETGKPIEDFPAEVLSDMDSAVASSSKGLLAVLSRPEPLVWLTNNRKLGLVKPVLHTTATTVLFSRSGRYLATVSADNTVRIWSLGEVAPSPSGAIRSTELPLSSLSDDGSCGVYVSESGAIIVRRTRDDSTFAELHTKDVLSRVAVSNGCKFVAGAINKGPVHLWNLAKSEVSDLPGLIARDLAPSLIFSPDGKHLAASEPRRISLWDTAPEKSVMSLALPGPFFIQFSFTPDSRILFTNGPFRGLHLWWANSGQEINGPKLPYMYSDSIAFDRESRLMTVGGREGAYLINLQNPASFEKVFSNARVTSMALNSDGSLIAAIVNGTLKMWDVRRRVAKDSPSRDDLSTVRFDAAIREWFLVTSQNSSVQLWDTRTMAPIGSPVFVSRDAQESNTAGEVAILSAEFTSDGKSVVVVTPAWAHLLAATETGLQPVNSRLLSLPVRSRSRVHLLGDSKTGVVVAGAISGVASNLEIVDFNIPPSVPEEQPLAAADWAKKVGLRLEQGVVVPR